MQTNDSKCPTCEGKGIVKIAGAPAHIVFHCYLCKGTGQTPDAPQDDSRQTASRCEEPAPVGCRDELKPEIEPLARVASNESSGLVGAGGGKPTIAEIEAILNSPEAMEIEIQPDGSITAVPKGTAVMQPAPYAEEEGGEGQATETPRPEPRPVRSGAWLERIQLFQHPTRDGVEIPSMWDVVRWRGWDHAWHLSWHRHNPKCRYGLYKNLKCRCGLVATLNLPLLGDWSVWAFRSGENAL